MPIQFPPRLLDPLQGPLLPPVGGYPNFIGPPAPLAGSVGGAATPRFGSAGLAVVLGQVAKAIDPNGIGGRLGEVGAGLGYNRLADQAMKGGPVSPMLNLQDRLALKQEQRAERSGELAEKYYGLAETQNERDAAYKDLQMEQLRYEAGRGRELDEQRLQGVMDYYNESTLAAKQQRLAQMDDRQREIVERQNLKNLMFGMPSILGSQGIKLPKEFSPQALSGLDPSQAMSLLAPYMEKYVKKVEGPSAASFAGNDALLGLPTGQSQNLYETGLLSIYANHVLSGSTEKVPDSVISYVHGMYPETRELIGKGMSWNNFGVVSKLVETDPISRNSLGLPPSEIGGKPEPEPRTVPTTLEPGSSTPSSYQYAGMSPAEILKKTAEVKLEAPTPIKRGGPQVEETRQLLWDLEKSPEGRRDADALRAFVNDAAYNVDSPFSSGPQGDRVPTTLGAMFFSPVEGLFKVSQGPEKEPRTASSREILEYALALKRRRPREVKPALRMPVPSPSIDWSGVDFDRLSPGR